MRSAPFLAFGSAGILLALQVPIFAQAMREKSLEDVSVWHGHTV